MSSVLPPLTNDCCQTFATLSAVLLSSLGFAVMLSECCTTSTVNYLLYISAWMHQLTLPFWPSKGARPTTSDLNRCLHLREFFPSRVEETQFDIVFYNQPEKVMRLLNSMCTSYTRKRPRSSDGLTDICGYVIVSGDYTVSVFSICHDTKDNASSRYAEAWSFYICDSHGTQPWSQGTACLCGVTFGELKENVRRDSSGSRLTLSRQEGVQWFSSILCILLEEHRKSGVAAKNKVPYMTWTPIMRQREKVLTVRELITRIDEEWIPCVFSDPNVEGEAQKRKCALRKCFMGVV
ncbi:hypothetical protein STCU_00103 [Strigomonas culicis]|nr:hypothetical protein STCU_01214 [Strigomonas culicis]EPY37194.1 hypothetical protein STCU_00103 [Strigomonas culicis]|eukprot:EPY35172.1 hypothetical protein STCU_01214 [Strigomonas culicis]